MNQGELINKALRLPPSAIPYYVTQQLATLFPDKAIIESDDYFFKVEEYSENGLCTITSPGKQYNEFLTAWYETDYEPDMGEYTEGRLYKRAYNACQEINWQGTM